MGLCGTPRDVAALPAEEAPGFALGGLQAGSLQVVATDHCSFTSEQKRIGRNDFRMIPNGTGGLEDRMPVLWTAGVGTGRLTKEEFVAVTSTNIARILNIYPRKGAVAVGADADLVIWDPAATKTIRAKKQVSRIDYNVFEGYKCTGVPWITISRGKIAWKDGDLRAEKGDGDFVARPPSRRRMLPMRRGRKFPRLGLLIARWTSSHEPCKRNQPRHQSAKALGQPDGDGEDRREREGRHPSPHAFR